MQKQMIVLELKSWVDQDGEKYLNNM